MDFGITFGALYADPQTYLKYAREAEAGGYSYLFYPDSQLLYRDPFSNMGAAALVTKEIKLGTMVSPVTTRHPTVLANCIHTVNEISNGRAILVLGAGDSGVRMIGQKPSTPNELADSIEYMRRLTQGDRFDFGTGQFGMEFAKGGIPFYVLAAGERMLKASGRVADGTMIFAGPSLTTWAIEQVRKGAESVGRDPGGIEIIWTGFCSMNEDRNVARARVKPSISWYCVRCPKLVRLTDVSLSPEALKKAEEFRKDYSKFDLVHSQNWEQAMKHTDFVPDDLIDRFAIAGNAEDVVRAIRNLERKGISKIAFRPTNPEDWYTVFKSLMQSVIPEFR